MKKIFFFILILIQNNLFSHTIILKDLKVFYGIIGSMNGAFVNFNSDKGPKKVRKDMVAKIIFQDVKDEQTLKKFLKKVKADNPNYVAPNESAPLPPSADTSDIEFESAKNLLAEIEEEEKVQALREKSSSALLKSLTFPGRGEYSFENKKTGIFYGSIFLFSLAGLGYSQHLVNNSRMDYEKTISQNVQWAYTVYNPRFSEVKSLEFYAYSFFQQQSAYSEFLDAGQLRNSLAAASVGVYLIQFLHTYWNVRSIANEKKVNVKVGFTPVRENNFLGMQASSWNGIFSISYQW